jgi:hypothetical protein
MLIKQKPDDEQMIDRIRPRFAAVKSIDQKDPAILVKRPGNPDRENHADNQIRDVTVNGIHDISFHE